MNSIIKRYSYILQLLLLLIPLLWVFNLQENTMVNNSVNIFMILFIIFTIIVSVLSNKFKKMYLRYTIMLIYMILTIVIFCITANLNNLNDVVLILTMVILPLGLITLDEVRISDRVFGLLIIILGCLKFFKIGDLDLIKEFSYFLIPLSLVIIYKEDNLLLKIIYAITSILLMSLIISEEYLLIFAFLIELAIGLFEDKNRHIGTELIYMFIFALGIVFLILEYMMPTIPITLLLSAVANKGFIKEKVNLMFTSYDLSIGGIETSLINLLNVIDKDKYIVNLYLERKRGSLLNKVNKNVVVMQYRVFNIKPKYLNKALNYSKRLIFSIFNYNTYDFSCCYATYSYSGNKLAKIASRNSSIWVHSNYRYVYKNVEDTLNFFDSRNMNDFRRIIFVSNESKNDYLELYPKHKEKALVFNNFVDIDAILNKSDESTDINKPKNKKLFIFVGRLDESSKKITRLIDIAKNINNITIWVIGDGKDRKMYENLIKDNHLEKKVVLLGSIKEPYNYMKKADYIILTSDYEGFPVVYLEALVLNKEIISTIPVSDEHLDFNKIAHIISKDNYIEDINEILKKEEKKNVDVNLKEAQYQRNKKLEKLFEGVI